MNTQPISILVTSKDGITFGLRTSSTNAPYEIAYASVTPSAELAKNSDFQQVKSLDDLIAPEEYYFSAPRISGPLERRAAFRVIKGGKQS